MKNQLNQHFLCRFWGKKNLALLLDYDGTLSPIAAHPDLANLPEKNRELLQFISSQPNVTVAIISGRGVEDAKKKVGFPEFIYGGNHGYEIHFPDGYVFTYQFNDDMQEDFKKMVWDLNAVSRFWIWSSKSSFTL